MLIKTKKHFISGSVVAFDTESTGLHLWGGDMPFAFSFCNEEGDIRYFEFPVDPFSRKVQRGREVDSDLAKIKALLEDEAVTKVGHNLKFDVRGSEQGYGIRVAGPGGPVAEAGRCFDTMFMAHRCNSDEPTYGLKPLADKYAGIGSEDQKELQKTVNRIRGRVKKLGWKVAVDEVDVPFRSKPKLEAATEADYWIPGTAFARGEANVSEEEAAVCGRYARLDAERTMMLHQFYLPLMERLGVRESHDREMELWPVVYRMETRGVRFDPENNELEIASVLKTMSENLEFIKRKAGENFNINAYAQMSKLLYQTLKLKPNAEHLTDGGQPGTSQEALKAFKENPHVAAILRYKGNYKAFGYFTQYRRRMVPDPLNPGSQVLKPQFRQAGLATNRFSAADPNIQQVTSAEGSRSFAPVEGRGSFGPRPGYAWLHNDYVGMEVRVFADFSQEPNMLAAIAAGREIHNEICNKAWGGEGNERGLREMAHALGLDGSDINESPEVPQAWKQLGVRPEAVRRLSGEDQLKIAGVWMARFGWDIVEAQAAVKRKSTKNKAKMLTFLKIYGGGVKAAMGLLGCSLEEAGDFVHHYDDTFPRIREYSRELIHQASHDGCVWTPWNTRLEVPRDFAYKAVNYMVQGSSADLLKSAMVKSDRWIRQNGLDAHLLLTIHDELVFEVAKAELTKSFIRKICSLMEDHDGRLGVSMPTDPSIAWHSWSRKSKVKL